MSKIRNINEKNVYLDEEYDILRRMVTLVYTFKTMFEDESDFFKQVYGDEFFQRRNKYVEDKNAGKLEFLADKTIGEAVESLLDTWNKLKNNKVLNDLDMTKINMYNREICSDKSLIVRNIIDYIEMSIRQLDGYYTMLGYDFEKAPKIEVFYNGEERKYLEEHEPKKETKIITFKKGE